MLLPAIVIAVLVAILLEALLGFPRLFFGLWLYFSMYTSTY